MNKRTPGPFTATRSASCHGKSRADMMDWASHIDCVCPFRDDPESDHGAIIVEDQTFARVCGLTAEQAIANAEFVTRACNAHDALVAALTSVTDTIDADVDECPVKAQEARAMQAWFRARVSDRIAAALELAKAKP